MCPPVWQGSAWSQRWSRQRGLRLAKLYCSRSFPLLGLKVKESDRYIERMMMDDAGLVGWALNIAGLPWCLTVTKSNVDVDMHVVY